MGEWSIMQAEDLARRVLLACYRACDCYDGITDQLPEPCNHCPVRFLPTSPPRNSLDIPLPSALP